MKLEKVTKASTRNTVIKAYEAFATVYEKTRRLVVSLPETNFIFEKNVLMDTKTRRKGHTHLICYENNPETFKENLDSNILDRFAEAQKEKAEHINWQFSTKTSEGEKSVPAGVTSNFFSFDYRPKHLPPVQHFDVITGAKFVWYDLCGVPSSDNLELVGEADVSAFTFCLAPRCSKRYNSTLKKPELLEKWIRTIIKNDSNSRANPILLHSQYYASNKLPMLLVIFTSNKEIEKVFNRLMGKRSNRINKNHAEPLSEEVKNEIRKSFNKLILKGKNSTEDKRHFRKEMVKKFNVSLKAVIGVTNWIKRGKTKTTETKNKTKLTLDQKQEIRNAYKDVITIKTTSKEQRKLIRIDLAKKFNVSALQIAAITNWVERKHVK